jgi:pyridoxal/pyridoxine/pyridoxamine kinase
MTIPRLKFHFTGTGDLTAALLLAWSSKLTGCFVTACERAIASVQVCHHSVFL